jgi:tRNA-(ms[2]io[6]A)-hydroxylase
MLINNHRQKSTQLTMHTTKTAAEFLLYRTPNQWLETVLADFDTFLCDHASAEKKASGMAVTMISHYPDKTELVDIMGAIAVEELNHFREVIKIIHQRGKILAGDVKDNYVGELRKSFRKGSECYMMDRLIIAGIIEARGAERFGIIADGLPDGSLKDFYVTITESEQRHYATFLDLAYRYSDQDEVNHRIVELLTIEAKICAAQPFRAALH